MKTTKFFSVLSLALIFFGVTAGTNPTNFPGIKSQNQLAPSMVHQVVIHTFFSKTLCNTYMVKVMDETGRLVAPPQIFIPGVSKYVFNETGNLKGRKRIATLELSTNPVHNACAYDIFTSPDVKVGPFKKGQVVSFDLYPRAEDPNIDL